MPKNVSRAEVVSQLEILLEHTYKIANETSDPRYTRLEHEMVNEAAQALSTAGRLIARNKAGL